MIVEYTDPINAICTSGKKNGIAGKKMVCEVEHSFKKIKLLTELWEVEEAYLKTFSTMCFRREKFEPNLTFLYQGAKTGNAYIKKMQETTSASKQANILRNLWNIDWLDWLRKLNKQPKLTSKPMMKRATIITLNPISSLISFFWAAKDLSSLGLAVAGGSEVNSKWKLAKKTSLLKRLLGDMVTAAELAAATNFLIFDFLYFDVFLVQLLQRLKDVVKRINSSTYILHHIHCKRRSLPRSLSLLTIIEFHAFMDIFINMVNAYITYCILSSLSFSLSNSRVGNNNNK